MDPQILKTYEDSLARCSADPRFFERFYEIFLAASPKIAEKFAHTDFEKQRKALAASLHQMQLAVTDGQGGPEQHLAHLAERHSSRDLGIGSEYYDYWLDSLLQAVRESDPKFDDEVLGAWDRVMSAGIAFLLSRY
jgi:hemoglobin-like flavoprotein